MGQLSLFDMKPDVSNWQVSNFSADNFSTQNARLDLEKRFINLTEISDSFNRQSVSFQLSKKDQLHRWLKYKEGFSSELVLNLLKDFKIPKGGWVMDPFLGSGTTAMVCQMNDINSVGFDILPMSKIAIEAKKNVFNYNISELLEIEKELKSMECPSDYPKSFDYLSITDGAFPESTAKEIAFFSEWNDKSHHSEIARNLIVLCILNSLETISYTAKDGQYLRWDYRSKKMREANEDRLAKGKRPIVVRLDKGDLPSLKETLCKEFGNVLKDIEYIQKHSEDTNAQITFIEGSALYELPKMENEILDGVITSPPYCNRYDYTRTYALELNYLNLSKENITKLRQTLLSCTVENKSKLAELEKFYSEIGRTHFYENTIDIINQNKSLNEIKASLRERDKNGDINNNGVLRMVDGYFTELTFIYAELYRLCRKGAKVAFVNDNVRYGGEVIPVDFISTELAEQIGFKPIKIITLRQQKGNSSQQMKKFGRVALRKSITIWGK